jgi:flagellar biosynthesis anti-sigma factor FlgM
MMAKMNISRMSGLEAARTDFQRDVRSTPAEDAAAAAKKAPVGEDRLDISSRAAEVGTLVGELKSMGDVRGGRVEALRGEVAAGAYQPEGEQIADAMIDGQ